MTHYRQLGLLGLLAVVVFASGVADSPKKTAFSELQVGRPVGLKDRGTTYEITVFDDNIPQSHKIVEVGEDFIVVEDVAKVRKTTIPVYSVKSIVRIEMP